jgi:hypothetical protein
MEVLREWAPNPRDLDRVLNKFSPEELLAIIEIVGSPKEAVVLLSHAKTLISEMLWRDEMKAKLARWGRAGLLVSAIAAAVNAFILWVLLRWPN